jgi:hypothetical protein
MMRYAVFGFCVLAVACSGNAPTAPTVSTSQNIGAAAAVQATASLEVPLKGTLAATEAVSGNLHHLVGGGTGTQLGRFSYAADITVDDATGDGAGTVTWTAANGDAIRATTAGKIVFFDFPTIGLQETQTITGGTGRFERSSGSIIVERSLNLDTGVTSGSFSGTLIPVH